MLNQIADGVWTHQSDWCESNTVVVRGTDGVLLVDPGIHAPELDDIAKRIADLGQNVVAGFATHPHWDHMLWIPEFGDAPRYATALAAATATSRLAGGIDKARFGIPEDTPLDLMGSLTGLPAGATEVPWDGPVVRILEHNAHASGHGALLIEDARVLVAGDMLSDVFIPMLDLMGAADPLGDYLGALDLFESVTDEVDVIVPGHGSIGNTAELRARIDRDRAYVEALCSAQPSGDARITSPKPGWEFVRTVHENQVARLGQDR